MAKIKAKAPEKTWVDVVFEADPEKKRRVEELQERERIRLEAEFEAEINCKMPDGSWMDYTTKMNQIPDDETALKMLEAEDALPVVQGEIVEEEPKEPERPALPLIHIQREPDPEPAPKKEKPRAPAEDLPTEMMVEALKQNCEYFRKQHLEKSDKILKLTEKLADARADLEEFEAMYGLTSSAIKPFQPEQLTFDFAK